MSKQESKDAPKPATTQAPKPKAQKRPAAVKQPAEATVYIGPALRGGRLARYATFRGGVLPPGIASIAAEHKAVQRLIVPVSKLSEYEKRLSDRSSLEAAMYAEATKIFSKEG